MQIFPSVLLHKCFRAIMLLRNLTIFFHSSSVWVLTKNRGKRCCPSLLPARGLLCASGSALTQHQRPFRCSTAPRGFCSSPDCRSCYISCKTQSAGSALRVWALSGKAVVQHCSGPGMVLWGIPTGCYSNPDPAVLPLALSHHRGCSKPRPRWHLRDNRSWGKTFVFDMGFDHNSGNSLAFF